MQESANREPVYNDSISRYNEKHLNQLVRIEKAKEEERIKTTSLWILIHLMTMKSLRLFKWLNLKYVLTTLSNLTKWWLNLKYVLTTLSSLTKWWLRKLLKRSSKNLRSIKASFLWNQMQKLWAWWSPLRFK